MRDTILGDEGVQRRRPQENVMASTTFCAFKDHTMLRLHMTQDQSKWNGVFAGGMHTFDSPEFTLLLMTLHDVFLSSENATFMRILAFDLSKFAAILMFPNGVLATHKTTAVTGKLTLDSPELALVVLVLPHDCLLRDELAALPGMLARLRHSFDCLRSISFGNIS